MSSPHPIAALGEVIKGLSPIICAFAGHRWQEYEHIDHWHDGHSVLIKTRKCINCGKIQQYKRWRYWCFLDPWVDI